MGAIAILFLFVLKLLNIRLVELKDNATRYVPVGLIMGLVLYVGLKNGLPPVTGEELDITGLVTYTKVASFTNIELLGLLLFVDYSYYFILAGFILLVAMIGAIVLTLGHEGEIKRQDIFEQISRKNIVS